MSIPGIYTGICLLKTRKLHLFLLLNIIQISYLAAKREQSRNSMYSSCETFSKPDIFMRSSTSIFIFKPKWRNRSYKAGSPNVRISSLDSVPMDLSLDFIFFLKFCRNILISFNTILVDAISTLEYMLHFFSSLIIKQNFLLP